MIKIRSRTRPAVAATVLAAGVLVAVVGARSPHAEATAAGSGPIVGYGGVCVDVPNGTVFNGERLQLWQCDNSGAQQFSLRSDGTVRVLGSCLDVFLAGTANGTPVGIADCNGTVAQQWTNTTANELVNPHAGACMDATGISSANGTLLQLWTCTGGPNQKWNVSAAEVNPSVAVTMTSTDEAFFITRALQAQSPAMFTPGNAADGQVINVDENVTYQQFVGGGASFTDTAAWLMNSSGALSPAARDTVMTALFDPNRGIGLSFLRNPMGTSDLARINYSYDDLAAGQTDPGMTQFSIDQDRADVLPLTKWARELNPAMTVMATPWSAPAWMKDSGVFEQGTLKPQFYSAYAQYFVKYIQAYQAQGVPITYVTVQNEPSCCPGTPSMNWTSAALLDFTLHFLFPALHNAQLSTKVLVHDWNWSEYDQWGAPLMNSAALRNDPNFGGIAWHGYSGDPSTQTSVHNLYPAADAFDTEHSGGVWANNAQQHDADMNDIINYTRNWGRSVTKWSLATDQNLGPHNGGCGTCEGLIVVHHGDDRSGEIYYTIEYYDMGQLTKFVRPGAYRIDSTASITVPNVAWRNPDGSKALIAYNKTATDQVIRVNWGTQTFSYTVPPRTAATFTWQGIQQNVVVPDLTGLSQQAATAVLHQAGLNVGAVSTRPVNDRGDGGSVFSQSPPAGGRLGAGAAVNLTVNLWNGNNL
jgi:glucosylceramidase